MRIEYVEALGSRGVTGRFGEKKSKPIKNVWIGSVSLKFIIEPETIQPDQMQVGSGRVFGLYYNYIFLYKINENLKQSKTNNHNKKTSTQISKPDVNSS